MTRMQKDGLALGLTTLAVLTFIATHQGWNVWLVGGSHRWAAVAIFLLGAFTCGLGEPQESTGSKLLPFLGATALVLAAIAIATGSLTPLSLLVVTYVLLWGFSTVGHMREAGHTATPRGAH